MGPYYRGTSQGMGNIFEMFYDHPLLMLIFVAGTVGVGYFVWRRKKSEEKSG
jgi:hypothetical protein